MSDSSILYLDNRIARLERDLRFSRLLVLGVSIIAFLAILVALYALQHQLGENSRIVRARGLVLVDAQNRPRILAGTPIPPVPERKRKDGDGGLIILGADGTDRLQLGFNPGPQCNGVVSPRIAAEVGMIFNDADGSERGGLGVMQNQRAVLGLDYPDCRESVELYVLPDKNRSGLSISADGPGEDVDRFVVEHEKGKRTYLYLMDENNKKRLELHLDGTDAPKLDRFNEQQEGSGSNSVNKNLHQP